MGRLRSAAEGPRRDVQSGQPLPARDARGGRRRLGGARAGRRATADGADAPPPLKTVVRDPAGAHDHRAQRFARHPVHAVDQSVPGLRARLHLLLRAAVARLSRPVAGPRLRDEALRQAQRRRAAARRARQAGLRLRADRARHQHRPVPADRARVEDHALGDRGARRLRSSAHDHHQGRADRARPRPARADGREEPRPRLRLDRDAGQRARAQARSARAGAAPPAADRQGRSPRPACRSASWSRRSFRSSPTRTRGDPRGGRRRAARRHAGWIMLRLPREVAPLFRDWLDVHYPLRAAHVMSLVQQIRGGRDNDPALRRAHARQRRFRRPDRASASRSPAAGWASTPSATPLDTMRFRPPAAAGAAARESAGSQLDLF